MAEFDPNEMFNTPNSWELDVPSLKPFEFDPASVPGVDPDRAAKLAEATQRNREALTKTLAARLHVDGVPILEDTANNAASVWSGGARVLANALTAPIDAVSGLAQGSIPGNVIEAYNREQNRTPLPGDAELLNSEAPVVDGISQTFANRLQSINTMRQASKSIFDTLDLSGLVKQDNRQELSEDIAHDTRDGVRALRAGVQNFEDGNYLKAAKHLSKGLGQTAAGAIGAAAQNPRAIGEYVGENVPQLALGAINPATLAFTNAGYGLNEYRDGITDYQAEHSGAMPKPDDLNKMAVNATLAAVAENVGEMGSVKALLNAGKGGIKTALVEIGEAALKEGATEGAQTYFENNAHLKDTSIEDVVEAATIGAAVGGVFGGAGAIGNREHSSAPSQTGNTEAYNEALKTGNIDSLADPESRTYDPVGAVQVLTQTALSDTAAPEAKQAAVERAESIKADIQSQIDQYNDIAADASPEGLQKLSEQRDIAQAMVEQAATPEEAQQHSQAVEAFDAAIKDAGRFNPEQHQAQIEQLQTRLADVEEATDRLRTAAAPKGEELDQVVQQASQSEEAANKVLTLTMINPESFTKDQIDSLVSDSSNNLSTDQRDALRSYSVAQEATEQFKDLHGVNSDIINGGQGYKGIPQYREQIRDAVAQGDQAKAREQVVQLDDFAKSRASKAAAITQAYDQVKGTDQRLYVAPDAQGNWAVSATEQDGGQYVDARSFKLRDKVNAEADVLAKTAESFKAFIKANGTVAPVVSQKEAAPAPEPVTDAGKLAVIRDTPKVSKTDPGEYTSGSMLGKFFDQQASKGKGKTARPLVANHNFLSGIIKDFNQVNEFLAAPVDPIQEAAVRSYLVFARNAAKEILAVFPHPKAQGYEFQQYSGSLRNADGSIPQNVVAAVAYGMHSYLGDQGTPFNSDKSINAILGRDSDVAPSNAEYALFGRGEQHSFVAGDIGKDIADALGLKAVAGAPVNEQVRLELALGEVAIQAMVRMGVAEKVSVPIEEVNRVRIEAGLEPMKGAPKQRFNYIRSKWTQNAEGRWEAHPTITKIRDANKGTQSVVAKLFGSNQAPKEPTLEPVPFTQTKAKRTDQDIPSVQIADLKAVAKRPHQVVKSMWNIFENVSPEALYRMNGVDPDAVVHVRNSKSAEAKKNQLQNEVDSTLGWVRDNLLQPGKDLDTSFYILPEVWSNQRAGITQNVMDPQTNKFARFAIQQTDWDTTYDTTNPEHMTRFKLRVLEGFGVKTETNVPDATINHETKGFSAWLQKPEISAAVDALVALQQGEQFSEDDIVAGVAAGGEKYHTLQALQALAEYKLAKNNTFTTSLIGEGDGINNGPTLAMILYGASNKALLNKGGIFTDGEFTTFGEYKSQPGAHDVYQGIMASILKAIPSKVQPLVSAIEGVLGPLSNANGGIESAGRNIVKTPLTALVFGSNYKRAAEAMAETFIDNTYAKMEKVAGNDADRKALVQSINALLENTKGVRKIPENIDRQTLLETELTDQQEAALKNAFGLAIGEAAETALEEQFGEFVKSRNVFNQTANAAHKLYDMAYKVLRAQMLKDVPTVVDKKRSDKPMPLHDLSRVQQAELAEKLKAMAPIINSYMSLKSKQPEAGMFMGKRVTQDSTDSAYSVQTKLSAEAPVVDVNGNPVGSTSTSTLWGSLSYMGEPGVATASRSVHSGDSAIASASYGKHNMLNVHDALAGPDWQLADAMKSMNFNTLDLLVNYSPMYEMQRSYENSIIGFAKLMEDPEFAAAVAPDLKQAFTVKTKDGEKTVSPYERLYDIATAAKVADQQKYDLLKGVTHVGQYSNENGTHVVTEQDQKALADKAAELKGRLNKDAVAAAQKIRDALKAPAPVQQSIKPKSTQPKVEQNSTFNAFLENIEARAESLQDRINESIKALEDEFNALDRNPNMTPAERTRHAELDGSLLSLSGASDIAQGRGSKEAQARLQNLISPALFAEVMALREEAKAGPTVQPTVESVWGKVGKPVMESSAPLVSALKNNANMTGHQLVDLVRSQPGVSDFTKKLLGAVKRTTKASLKVVYVTPKTPLNGAIGVGVENSRGWYAADSTQEGIFIKSPDFVESGINVEMLTHELVHAAVAQTIASEEGKNSPAGKLIQELEALRVAAAKATEGQTQYAQATSNVQELVAWGMSNEAFQQKVLAKIEMPSKQSGNKLVSGIRAFIDTLTGLLFGNKNVPENTGMGLMIQNVSGLMKAASESAKADNSITLKYEDAVDEVRQLNTEELYEALAQKNTSLPTDPVHDTHLRTLINGPIKEMFGAMGALKDRMVDQQSLTNEDVFLKAMNDGKLPFSSNALGLNIVLNTQEAFMTEQVEATVRAGLEINNTLGIRTQLQSLYDQARKELKGKLTQDKYDYLFHLDTTGKGKSDHLSRFAALGLASQEVNAALGFSTADNSKAFTDLPLGAKLVELFRRLVTRLVSLHTKTFAGQSGNSQLSGLVNRLVEIEGKYKQEIAQNAASRVNELEDSIDGLGEKLRNGANRFANSTLFTATDNTVLKLVRNGITTVANDRVGMVLDAMNQLRNIRYPNQQEGIFAGTITEMRGNTDTNEVADALYKNAKEGERIRQKAQEGVTQMTIQSFDEQGAYLTPAMRTAVTKHFLRTDAQALMDHVGMSGLLDAMRSPAALAKVQKDLETQVKAMPNGRGMIYLAKQLAHMMVDGRSTSEATVLNTYNIANMIGQSSKAKPVTKEQAKLAEATLNPLVSAYAMQYEREANTERHSAALAVFEREHARGSSSGVEMILRLHKDLQKQSEATLFAGSPMHRIQGYLPEIHDNKIDVFAVARTDLDPYLKRGYREVGPVQEDPNAPHKGERVMITRRNSGSDSVLSGAFNTTSNGRRGTNVRESTVSLNSDQTWMRDDVAIAKLTKARQAALDAVLTASDSYDPRKQPTGHAVAVFDSAGKTVDYRYMMGQQARDALLQRDNNMDTLLGRYAAQNIDKAEVEAQNHGVIGAMYDFYKDNYAADPRAYVTVGKDSTDPQLAELYRLLPRQAKEDIKRTWGENNMYIRADQLNLIMGYRKFSLTQAFDKEERRLLGGSSADLNTRNIAEQMFVSVAEAIMGEKAQWQVGKVEDVVQEVNAWIKDTLVVRNISTLVGNMKSNLSIAVIQGVPFKDIVRDHAIGVKAALDYRRDSKRELQLQKALEIGYVPQGQTEVERELVVLRDRLARSPIKPLVDAGLMPTIAEDIEATDSPYGYKGRAAAWIDSKTGKVPGFMKTIGKNVVLTHDTEIYKFLSQTTQLSDLVSRYVVYQHITTRAKNPLSKVDALKQIENDFVNYDRPSHKMVEYLNSVGVLRFTKYTLRIQKTLTRLFREKPLRSLSAIILSHHVAHLDQVFSGSWINHINSPLHAGPSNVFDAFEELPAIQLLP